MAAIRSYFSNLTPVHTLKNIPHISRISSNTSRSSSVAPTSAQYYNRRRDDDDLRARLLKLVFPRRSAGRVLQNWVEEGGKVEVQDLRIAAKDLLRCRRYKHALEVMTWMEAQERFQLSATDHALRLELILKVSTLREGEEYFANLRSITSQKAAFLPLLNSYVRERSIEKAEALMLKMNESGLVVAHHPFNSMMKLYMATSQFEKVLSVILLMKQNKIPRDVLSYNIWMTACAKVSGFESAEMVYKEMVTDECVEVGWSSLSTLASIYQQSGLVEKATWALKHAEKKLSTSNHLGYFFLITQYASLKNKDAVLRIWEACKQIDRQITCANYMCILLCLVKLGDVEEAEKIFLEWESQCRNYDIRVSNVLLGAYVRNGLMRSAESLHLRTQERGGRPNFKTWEILMEGWIKAQDMEKAVTVMRNGFAMLKGCLWRPSPNTVEVFVEYFEKNGKFEDAEEYLKLIRPFGLASLVVYKSLIRMHISSKRPIDSVIKMMREDKIDMDNETLALAQAL